MAICMFGARSFTRTSSIRWAGLRFAIVIRVTCSEWQRTKKQEGVSTTAAFTENSPAIMKKPATRPGDRSVSHVERRLVGEFGTLLDEFEACLGLGTHQPLDGFFRVLAI